MRTHGIVWSFQHLYNNLSFLTSIPLNDFIFLEPQPDAIYITNEVISAYVMLLVTGLLLLLLLTTSLGHLIVKLNHLLKYAHHISIPTYLDLKSHYQGSLLSPWLQKMAVFSGQWWHPPCLYHYQPQSKIIYKCRLCLNFCPLPFSKVSAYNHLKFLATWSLLKIHSFSAMRILSYLILASIPNVHRIHS